MGPLLWDQSTCVILNLVHYNNKCSLGKSFQEYCRAGNYERFRELWGVQFSWIGAPQFRGFIFCGHTSTPVSAHNRSVLIIMGKYIHVYVDSRLTMKTVIIGSSKTWHYMVYSWYSIIHIQIRVRGTYIGSMILDPRIDMIFLPPSCIYLPHSCPLLGCTCYQSSTGRLSHSLLHHSRCYRSPRNSQSVPAHSEKPADQSSSVWMQLKRR